MKSLGDLGQPCFERAFTICVCNEVLEPTLRRLPKKSQVSYNIALRDIQSRHFENLQLVLANIALMGVHALTHYPFNTWIVDYILQMRSLQQTDKNRFAIKCRPPNVRIWNFFSLPKNADHESSTLFVLDKPIFLPKLHIIVLVDDIPIPLVKKPVYSLSWI